MLRWAGGRWTSPGDDTDATITRPEAWWANKRHNQEEAEPARTGAYLPRWILDLANTLGLVRTRAGRDLSRVNTAIPDHRMYLMALDAQRGRIRNT